MSESDYPIGQAARRARDIAVDEGLPLPLAVQCAAAEYGVDPIAVVEKLAAWVSFERALDSSA